MTTAIEQGVTTRRKPFGKNLLNYLVVNPSEYDVTFLVGPEKKEIRSLRIALKAASPALDKLFKEKWDIGLGKDESGIPLAHLDPVAFQIFIELLFLDDWSVEEIESMKLSAETILNLLQMSKDFQIEDLKNVFQLLANKIFMDFERFSKLEDFLKLSRENVEMILASDLLTLNEAEIFSVACKWAEKQCFRQGLEPNGPNLRNSLGSAIFKIRFPLMTNTEFANIVYTKQILTNEEQLQIFLYNIPTGSQNTRQVTSFPFSTQQRTKSSGKSGLTDSVSVTVPFVNFNQNGILNFFKDVNCVIDPPFVCDGEIKRLFLFNVSSRIALESIGFLGPVNGDATYDVTIQILVCPPIRRTTSSDSDYSFEIFGGRSICFVEKKVEAKQGQIFHVSFENRRVIEAYSTPQQNEFSLANGYYFIEVSLKVSTGGIYCKCIGFCCFFPQGPNTQSAQFLNGFPSIDLRSEVDGTTIYTRHYYEQGAEIKFKKC